MIYLYNDDPSDCLEMYLDYFRAYYPSYPGEQTWLLNRYKYISTKDPRPAK